MNKKEQKSCDDTSKSFVKKYGVVPYDVSVRHHNGVFSNGKIIVCGNKYSEDQISKLPERYWGFEITTVYNCE